MPLNTVSGTAKVRCCKGKVAYFIARLQARDEIVFNFIEGFIVGKLEPWLAKLLNTVLSTEYGVFIRCYTNWHTLYGISNNH